MQVRGPEVQGWRFAASQAWAKAKSFRPKPIHCLLPSFPRSSDGSKGPPDIYYKTEWRGIRPICWKLSRMRRSDLELRLVPTVDEVWTYDFRCPRCWGHREGKRFISHTIKKWFHFSIRLVNKASKLMTGGGSATLVCQDIVVVWNESLEWGTYPGFTAHEHGVEVGNYGSTDWFVEGKYREYPLWSGKVIALCNYRHASLFLSGNVSWLGPLHREVDRYDGRKADNGSCAVSEFAFCEQ